MKKRRVSFVVRLLSWMFLLGVATPALNAVSQRVTGQNFYPWLGDRFSQLVTRRHDTPLSQPPTPAPKIPEAPKHTQSTLEIPLPHPRPQITEVETIPLPIPRPRIQEVAQVIPLPLSRPRTPTPRPLPKLVMSTHTAVYDIATRVVYMPDGSRLEAHSGSGRLMDDPTKVRVVNHGPTPPNLYDLVPREGKFHGVEAIRLEPVGHANMYGRVGLLVHPYMAGDRGDSQGCVSVKDYEAFLRAYKRGEVKRLVVVPHIEPRSRFAGVQ